MEQQPEKKANPVKSLIVALIIAIGIIAYLLITAPKTDDIPAVDVSVYENKIKALEAKQAMYSDSIRMVTKQKDSLSGILKQNHINLKAKKDEIKNASNSQLDSINEVFLLRAGLRK